MKVFSLKIPKPFWPVFILLLCVLATKPLLAFESLESQRWKRLEQKLTNIQTLHTSFSQQTQDAKGDNLQAFDGLLIYQAPTRFFWQANEPLAQTLVSDGESIWHYDADLEQVVVQAYQAQADQALLLQILQQPKRLSKDFVLLANEATDDLVLVEGNREVLDEYVLEAKEQGGEIVRVILLFQGNTLLAFSFVDGLMQQTHVQLSHKRDAIDAQIFGFQIPDGVDVIEE